MIEEELNDSESMSESDYSESTVQKEKNKNSNLYLLQVKKEKYQQILTLCFKFKSFKRYIDTSHVNQKLQVSENKLKSSIVRFIKQVEEILADDIENDKDFSFLVKL
mmetsp:Transcript_6204/g.5794  ORF Transcript_6204/g.5794 Transcript_6204/m.5794 type:complete len:107 (-) Transcript_6204:373-693(-)